MAYKKPGVEITQEQRSQTPIFISPELTGVIVGKGYHWVDPSSDDSFLDNDVATYDGSEVTFHLSDINSNYYNVSGVESLVVVDLVESADTIHHLVYSTDYTVSDNQVTILADSGFTTSGVHIRVGYLADKPESEGFKEMASVTDIQTLIGDPVTWNPLAYGAKVAQQQYSLAINTYGLDDESGINHSEAISALEMQDVYAIAFMSHDSSILANALSHVNTMSLADNKKERITVVNRPIPAWTGTAHAETNAQKSTTAEGIRDVAVAYQEKRLFMSFPDWGYVEETRHIATINPTWIANSFDSFTTNADTSYFQCQFAADVKVGTTRYKKGEVIDTTKWQALVTAGYHTMTVLSPVPGFYYDAAVTGQIIGKSPEAPLTNVPISGVDRTYGSWDYFTEAQLNTIAEGGYYIMTQRSLNAPVVCRHQMSTNVLSVALRELSITTAVDYTAKYIRRVLAPYIGRYIIDTKFLSLTDTILKGIGENLITAGILSGFSVASVTQSELNPDTVECEVDLSPLYPVNYIRITLVF